MTIKVGDTLPEAVFMKSGADGPEPVESATLFAGRKVALFSVPGAYTPTCSAAHLPSFIAHADALRAKGVDEIVGTSVNDVFVMKAWGKSAGVEDEITLLADGNAAFVTALGLDMDASKFGMGVRGQRFSMLVNDGVVEQLNIEAPGAYEVSSAEHMLSQM